MRSSNPQVPVDILVKQYGPATYIFAVGMRDAPTTATFEVSGHAAAATRAVVLGEDRAVQIRAGRYADEFQPYEVHLDVLSPRDRRHWTER